MKGEPRIKDGVKFTFYSVGKTWEEAVAFCFHRASKLLSFDDPTLKNNIGWVVENMAELDNGKYIN